MITMVMMMNAINNDENGYFESPVDPNGSNEDVAGMTNMFIKNSSHYIHNDDDVNI